jgi:hypothetical protein
MGEGGAGEEKRWRARKAFFSFLFLLAVSDRVRCAVQGAWLHPDRPSYYDLITLLLVALYLLALYPRIVAEQPKKVFSFKITHWKNACMYVYQDPPAACHFLIYLVFWLWFSYLTRCILFDISMKQHNLLDMHNFPK